MSEECWLCFGEGKYERHVVNELYCVTDCEVCRGTGKVPESEDDDDRS